METNKTEELKSLLINRLIHFFSGDEGQQKDEDRITNARMAMVSLAGVSRLLATDGAKEAVQFAVIRTITTDEKERKRYIQATLPGYMPKLLKDK